MQAIRSTTRTPRPLLDRTLAILGSGLCLVVSGILWGSIGAQQDMWPLPGLYFIEMAAMSVVCALLAFMDGGPLGRFMTWSAVGIFIGFSILGAWSVGFVYLPVAIIFAVIAIRSDLRDKQHIAAHIAVAFIAGVGQVVLMLAVIRLLF